MQPKWINQSGTSLALTRIKLAQMDGIEIKAISVQASIFLTGTAMRLAMSYPEKALWKPVFRVWHLGCRKINDD